MTTAIVMSARNDRPLWQVVLAPRDPFAEDAGRYPADRGVRGDLLPAHHALHPDDNVVADLDMAGDRDVAAEPHVSAESDVCTVRIEPGAGGQVGEAMHV